MFYNEDQKNRFLEHYSEDVSYTDHFINSARQAAKVEMQLGKDLIFFNRKEVSQLLKIYKQEIEIILEVLCAVDFQIITIGVMMRDL